MGKSIEKNKTNVTMSNNFGQDNNPRVRGYRNRSVVFYVSRIESLYHHITQEIEEACLAGRSFEEAKVENWSREIDKLYAEVASMPVSTLEELQAKISLNLMLMSWSMMDQHAVSLYSNNIMSDMSQFKDSHAMMSLLKTG